MNKEHKYINKYDEPAFIKIRNLMPFLSILLIGMFICYVSYCLGAFLATILINW